MCCRVAVKSHDYHRISVQKILIFRIIRVRSATLANPPALDEAGFSAVPMKILMGMDYLRYLNCFCTDCRSC
ncbi:MAG: hypothetical protein DWI22_21670 [Planctomycetota bacterium]|nr:MAG: hypothetical protein DWI22_21670 [Planctomycetota bacterium]